MKTSKYISLILLALGLMAGVSPIPFVASAQAGRQTASSPFAGEWCSQSGFDLAGNMTITAKGRVSGGHASFEGSSSFSGSISSSGTVTLTIQLGPLRNSPKVTATGTAVFDADGNLVVSLVYSHGGTSTEVWFPCDP